MKRISKLFVIVALTGGMMLTTSCSADAAAKFEYKIVSLDNKNAKTPEQLEATLNQYGTEGWEMIEVSLSGWVIFKRKK